MIGIFYVETRNTSRVFLQLGVKSRAITFVNDALLTPTSYTSQKKLDDSIIS